MQTFNQDEEVLKEVISNRIRVARKGRGMTQQKLGDLLEKTQQEISEIEQGERSVGFDILQQIAEVLDAKLHVGFVPTDLDEFDEDHYINSIFALPVGLVQDLNKCAKQNLVSTDEFVEQTLRKKVNWNLGKSLQKGTSDVSQ